MLEPKTFRGQPGSNGSTQKPLSDVLRLKVVLLEVVPPVWRRVQVPANLTLRQLHAVLQCAMGWTDSEAHLFRVGAALYGRTSDASDPTKDSRWVTVGDASVGATSFRYDRVAGDRWEHEIRIEAVAKGNPNNQQPICLAGERACPPDDCGGPEDYVDRVTFLTPSLSLDRFDPEYFDLEAVNQALSWLR
ncbi:MAG: plasmid pRiA4b ORF-3 family protein [Thermoanaerobaculia bacterium]